MENQMGGYAYENDLKDTELRLGLPGSDVEKEKQRSCSGSGSVVRSNKRCSPVEESIINSNASDSTTTTSDDHNDQPAK